MKIFIPTWKRLNKQKTLNHLHDKSNVWLAVRQEEAEEALKIHENVFVLDGHVSNFPETVENIVMRNIGERVLIADDDLKFCILEFDRPTESGHARWTNSITAEEEVLLWARVNKMMDDGYVHGGFWHAGSSPKKHNDVIQKPEDICARYNNVKWYDLSAFDPRDYNWTDVVAAEDYHVAMQLLLDGYESINIRDFAFKASQSHAAGGCSVYRTNEVHNESNRKLAELYPDFITANEPNEKGIVTVTIMMKKAGKYGQEQKRLREAATLDSFFA